MQINDNIFTYEEKVLFALRELFCNNGYTRFTMSRFEEYDLYANCKDFLVSDRIITFTDLDGRLVALKPDVTMSIVRQFARSGKATQKVYYNENVYRSAQGGRNFKEIMQTGVEFMGELDSTDICKTVALAVQSLNVISDNYILALSHPDFVEGIIEAADAYDGALKFVRSKNASGLVDYCNEKNIDSDKTELLLKLITIHGKVEDCLEELCALKVNDRTTKAVNEIKVIYDYLKECGIGDKVQIDFSIANNMDYYDGIVFQGYVQGIPQSLLSGGQYGGLMQKLGKKCAAVGFAVYMDELRFLKNE